MEERNMRTKEIIEILMRRDHLTLEQAKDEIREAKSIFRETLQDGGDYEEAAEAMQDFLGLEPDYFFC